MSGVIPLLPSIWLHEQGLQNFFYHIEITNEWSYTSTPLYIASWAGITKLFLSYRNYEWVELYFYSPLYGFMSRDYKTFFYHTEITNEWSYTSTPLYIASWSGITKHFFIIYVTITYLLLKTAVFQYDKEHWVIQNFGFVALKPYCFLTFIFKCRSFYSSTAARETLYATSNHIWRLIISPACLDFAVTRVNWYIAWY